MYDAFVEKIVEKAKALTIGHGFDEKSGGGPVVSALLQFRIISLVPGLISP